MISPALTLSGVHYDRLGKHLFPGDGKEAAAILVCTRTPGPRLRLLVKDLILVPHGECRTRRPDEIDWPGVYLEKAIDVAEPFRSAVVLIHSHPGGLFARYLDQLDIDQVEVEQLTAEVLATFASEAAVKQALAGWEKAMNHHDSLDWLRERASAGAPPS